MYDANKNEQEILKYWGEHKCFEKSVSERPASPDGGQGGPEGKPYVFYDGPPFATGLPHYGHILSSVIKDVVPRYWTMKGYRVRRRWGWDCHGLPIENIVEKELKISGKKDIEEKLGVDKFNETCRSKVLMYTKEWKKMIDRIGRWIEFDNAYKTMDSTYMESVWWALKTIWDKGLIYEGRKVLMYCPRCETPVSKAEIAMDNSYKDISEETVTVKFKIRRLKDYKITFPEDTYILAWTTTPWTLPGNVALAVGKDITYVVVEVDGENLILAEDRLSDVLKTKTYNLKTSLKGSDLVDLEYEPLFDIPAIRDTGQKAWYVTEADFVTTVDGTGVVHTAVVYGEEDYNLGLKIGLPVVPLLDSKGLFNEYAPDLIRGQYFKKAEKVIKEDLETRGLMFKKENFTHSYPHCWRCDTQLFYNALSAWFINIQKVKSKLIKNNEKVNWYPEHLKHGRFLNILETAPDWNISRNRFWATPLPFWKCECGHTECVGSVEQLRERGNKKITKLTFVRHGESEKNILQVNSSAPDKYPLTKKGEKEAQKLAKKLGKDFDVMIASPILRTKQTAEIIAKELDKEVVFDDSISEYKYGAWEDVSFKDKQKDPVRLEYKKLSIEDKFKYHFGGNGESREEIVERVREFINKIAVEYEGKNVLIVSHGGINAAMHKALEDISLAQYWEEEEIPYDAVQTFYLDGGKSLDLHKHNIDQVKLKCDKCGKEMRRIPEVIDCWVESASMPFAEFHYPFENKETFKKRFPGQYIAEYIAQTRAWFYYMHVMAGLLFDDVSFENVVCTGTILNEKGEKLSKSKMNYTDPWVIIERYGTDALRYYLLTSVVMQADDLYFNDNEVKEVYNKVVNLLWNVVEFYKMYSENGTNGLRPANSTNILDRWIMARLNELVKITTEEMDKYNTVKAGRPIKDFVDDLSTWYVRRSRDRFKIGSEEDKRAAIATLHEVLLTLSKVMAPFTPFMAEKMYLELGGELESVHLETWPAFVRPGRTTAGEARLMQEMNQVRKIVEMGLALRAEAGIKVRQPLSKLTTSTTLQLTTELAQIIADELNVKSVEMGNKEIGDSVIVKEDSGLKVALFTEITDELKKEGLLREVVRAINQIRKEQKLTISDSVEVEYATDDELLNSVFVDLAGEIKKSVLASDVRGGGAGEEVEIDGRKARLKITKI